VSPAHAYYPAAEAASGGAPRWDATGPALSPTHWGGLRIGGRTFGIQALGGAAAAFCRRGASSRVDGRRAAPTRSRAGRSPVPSAPRARTLVCTFLDSGLPRGGPASPPPSPGLRRVPPTRSPYTVQSTTWRERRLRFSQGHSGPPSLTLPGARVVWALRPGLGWPPLFIPCLGIVHLSESGATLRWRPSL